MQQLTHHGDAIVEPLRLAFSSLMALSIYQRSLLKHIQTSVVFVVRFYCLNDDVEYGFNFKLSRDETLN